MTKALGAARASTYDAASAGAARSIHACGPWLLAVGGLGGWVGGW